MTSAYSAPPRGRDDAAANQPVVEEMFMSVKMTKLAARAYLVLACSIAPVAVVHAQSGTAGGGQGGAGTGTGTGTAGTVAGQPGTGAGGSMGAGQPGGAGTAGAGGAGTAGAGSGSSATGQDLGYAQSNNNG